MRHARTFFEKSGDVEAGLVQPVNEGRVTITMREDQARAVLALVGKTAPRFYAEQDWADTYPVFRVLYDLLGETGYDVFTDAGPDRDSRVGTLFVIEDGHD